MELTVDRVVEEVEVVDEDEGSVPPTEDGNDGVGTGTRGIRVTGGGGGGG